MRRNAMRPKQWKHRRHWSCLLTLLSPNLRNRERKDRLSSVIRPCQVGWIPAHEFACTKRRGGCIDPYECRSEKTIHSLLSSLDCSLHPLSISQAHTFLLRDIRTCRLTPQRCVHLRPCLTPVNRCHRSPVGPCYIKSQA